MQKTLVSVIGLLLSVNAVALTVSATDIYCSASAAFEGQAISVKLIREDGENCEGYSWPKSVSDFNRQVDENGSVCFPLHVSISPKSQLLPEGDALWRKKFKLHVKYLPESMNGLSIKEAGKVLMKSTHLYAVAKLLLYEQDGFTWLLGYPRDISELSLVTTFNRSQSCHPN